MLQLFGLVSLNMSKILLVIFTFFTLWLSAQQPAYFLFGEQQFEGVDIYNVIQDNDGDYWFATDDGIYHHDGYSFEKLEIDEMKSVSVFNFTKDGRGRIYCHNLNQQVFIIENGKCRIIYEIPDLGNDISLEVNANNFLVINSGINLYVLNPEHRLVAKTNNAKGYLSALSEPINGCISTQRSGTNTLYQIDSKGEIYVNKLRIKGNPTSFNGLTLNFLTMDKQIYAVNPVEKTVYRFLPSTLELQLIKSSSRILSLAYSRFYKVNDELWVAGRIGGVKRICREADFFTDDNVYFEDQFVSDVFLDLEGNVLVSTFDAGVLVLPNLEVDDVVRELKDYHITRIVPSSDGSLIFGTKDAQLLRYKNGEIETLSKGGIKAIEFVFQPPNQAVVFSDNFGFSMLNLRSKKSNSPRIGSLKDVVALDERHFLLAMNIGVVHLEIGADPHEIVGY